MSNNSTLSTEARRRKYAADYMYAQTELAPQTRTIFNHLYDVGELSPVEAWSMYKCRSLTRRIVDIKEKLGCDIVTLRKRDHSGQRYTRYLLV